MDFVLEAVVLVRAARNTANIKNRQPLSLMYIKSNAVLDKEYESIITEEPSVRAIEFTQDVDGFVRELISKIQMMRKEAGFDALDRIGVYYGKNEVIEGIFTRNLSEIKSEVLANANE